MHICFRVNNDNSIIYEQSITTGNYFFFHTVIGEYELFSFDSLFRETSPENKNNLQLGLGQILLK
jgi:hypothetical protein